MVLLARLSTIPPSTPLSVFISWCTAVCRSSFHVSFVAIPRVNLRKAIALVSVDSDVTAGFLAVRFFALRFRSSVLEFSLRLRSLAG